MTIQEKIVEILNKESFKVTMSNGGGEFVGLTKEEQADQILDLIKSELPEKRGFMLPANQIGYVMGNPVNERDEEFYNSGKEDGFNEALNQIKSALK